MKFVGAALKTAQAAALGAIGLKMAGLAMDGTEKASEVVKRLGARLKAEAEARRG